MGWKLPQPFPGAARVGQSANAERTRGGMRAQAPRVSGEAPRQRLPLEPGAAESGRMTRPQVAARRDGEAARVAGGAAAAAPGRTPGRGGSPGLSTATATRHPSGPDGWAGRGLVAQWAALAQGTRLAPGGQATQRAQARHALGHHRQAHAAEALRRLQGPGLPAVAGAAVAGGQAPRAVLHLDEAVLGDGHAVRGAAERVQHRPRASHGLRGVDAPRLGITLVEEAPAALRRREGLGRLRPHPRPQGRAAEEGSQALATEDRAHGGDGAYDPRLGGAPAGPRRPQGCPWPPTVPVAMGAERLSPGRQDWAATALAPPVLAAALEPRLAGSLHEPRAQGAVVAQDAGSERMRKRKDAVARRHGQARGLAGCDPRRLRHGLTLGAVAMAA